MGTVEEAVLYNASQWYVAEERARLAESTAQDAKNAIRVHPFRSPGSRKLR